MMTTANTKSIINNDDSNNFQTNLLTYRLAPTGTTTQSQRGPGSYCNEEVSQEQKPHP